MSDVMGTPPLFGDAPVFTPEAPEVKPVSPEPISEPTKAEPQEDTPTAEKADASPAADPKAEPKKVDPRQRKLAELSYELREARRANERMNERLMGLVEKTTTQNLQGHEIKQPKIEDYQTIDDFLDAKLEYRDKQKAKTKEAEAEPDNEYRDRAKTAKEELTLSGTDKYDDFEEVVFSDGLKITPIMRDALFALSSDDSGLSADIAYYLGKNPKEAARIAKLEPVRQLTELGKLELKVSGKPEETKKPSAAPAPISPVGGSNTPSDEIAPVMDFKQFLKIRNKQLGRK